MTKFNLGDRVTLANKTTIVCGHICGIMTNNRVIPTFYQYYVIWDDYIEPNNASTEAGWYDFMELAMVSR